MLQSHTQQTNKNSLFQKIIFQRIFLFVEFFYSTNLSHHNFISQPSFTHLMYSLSFNGFFKQ